MKAWAHEETLLDAAQFVGVEVRNLRRDGRGYRFTLAPRPRREYERAADVPYRLLRPCPREGNFPAGRGNCWPCACDGHVHAVGAVCWHGHRDFMRAVFEREPDARIHTALADYHGAEDFERKYRDTNKNIGSVMRPLRYGDACKCEAVPAVELQLITAQRLAALVGR